VRVLVTGAAGFIGSHVCERLGRSGHNVRGLDTFLTGRRDTVAGWTAPVVETDVRFVGAMPAAELIVHCAASYSDPGDWRRDISTNTVGTAMVARAAVAWGARVIYFQTSLPAVSSYAASKIAGQHYLEFSGAPYVVLRLANVYGPRNLSGPIPTFYKRLDAGQPCTVVDTERDWVYVDDLIDLVDVVAHDERASGLYDVCSGRALRIRELYDAVAHAMQVHASASEIPPPPDDVDKMELDPRRAADELGWTPTTPLEEGVAPAVRWYEQHGVAETYTHLALKG